MAYQATADREDEAKFSVCFCGHASDPGVPRYQMRTYRNVSGAILGTGGIVSAALKALGRDRMSRIWQALRQAERERQSLAPNEGPDSEETETEPLSDEEEPRVTRGSDRRRERRFPYSATVLVYGSDAEKQPFHEQSETIDANDAGCLLTLSSGVRRGQRLVLTNMRNQAEQECRVVYVGRKVEGRFRVGIEFVRPAPQFWRKP